MGSFFGCFKRNSDEEIIEEEQEDEKTTIIENEKPTIDEAKRNYIQDTKMTLIEQRRKTEQEMWEEDIRNYKRIRHELKKIKIPIDEFGDLYKNGNGNIDQMKKMMEERFDLLERGGKIGGREDFLVHSDFLQGKRIADEDLREITNSFDNQTKKGGFKDLPEKKKLLLAFRGRLALLKKGEKAFFAKEYEMVKGLIDLTLLSIPS